MHRNPSRPLSPHLSIWRWGPHMLVSILHRVTGSGLALAAALLVWWLVAAATGAEAYATFTSVMGWLTGTGAPEGAVGWILYAIGVIIGVGLVWAFFQHTLSGLRHFVMDIGAGYELRTNRTWAVMTIVGSLLLTALFWAWILFGRGA
ncbi:succinate dehydrogenase, cytochrome b556 subunit [Sphingosinicella sp. LHD-64]|uniref:succinate dehydrogenase, cytochrome b556 subunit n=1 Tax=Sphingosinicella sp. LHD-64 TaxID=3072139 RepID=UPI00280CA9B3|nr:succinate dehydrogenase, cytochrome b556 subunit [Sphingosinicella sp. LHD-64]MDQ8756393.1 succinate dehydrogenase, cytochrome b556 subunit [Sphingosinicella sp. LHD-64]